MGAATATGAGYDKPVFSWYSDDQHTLVGQPDPPLAHFSGKYPPLRSLRRQLPTKDYSR